MTIVTRSVAEPGLFWRTINRRGSARLSTSLEFVLHEGRTSNTWLKTSGNSFSDYFKSGNEFCRGECITSILTSAEMR